MFSIRGFAISLFNSKRLFYIAAMAVTILLGLSSRKYSQHIPLFAADHAGDLLWAMMIYFGFRFLMVRMRLRLALICSFAFSFGIEFSQLYQEDWINHIRNTALGGLILGKGFLFIDLVRYTAGILIAALLDKGMLLYHQRR